MPPTEYPCANKEADVSQPTNYIGRLVRDPHPTNVFVIVLDVNFCCKSLFY